MWFGKYRLPDGRQVQKKIGLAWTERGRPPAGYFTKRTRDGIKGFCSVAEALARSLEAGRRMRASDFEVAHD